MSEFIDYQIETIYPPPAFQWNRFTAVTLAAALLCLTTIHGMRDEGTSPVITWKWTDSTAGLGEDERQLSRVDILQVLAGIHDRMLIEATDLSDQAKNVLYSNLWELYI